MLQQTQVATVLPYYNEWFRRFPDFSALARASESDVLHAWQGLGYYARACNLHATAKTIVDRHRCRFPKSIEQKRQLPGIGKYTGHAVAAFAFDQSVPIVEANVASGFIDRSLQIDRTRRRAFQLRSCRSWGSDLSSVQTEVPNLSGEKILSGNKPGNPSGEENSSAHKTAH